MAGDDRGRYLTSLEGATHELFGGDPEEIVLRVTRAGEGAAALVDLAREVRGEAARYERMAADGWRLAGAFTGGQARCRKDAGGAAPAAAGPPGRSEAASPADLADIVEGAATLPAAAARLRAAADQFERLDAEGRRLTGPVEGGRIPLNS